MIHSTDKKSNSEDDHPCFNGNSGCSIVAKKEWTLTLRHHFLTYSVGHAIEETPFHFTPWFLALGKRDVMTGLDTDHSK